MNKLNEYVSDLTTASRNGKLVFFVGAGLSALSNYPQWRELVDKYHVGLYGKSKDDKYSSDEYLRIPQIFYDVKGENEYDRILEEVFSVERPTNSIHDKILALSPVHIITTNYDDLIEKSCWKRGRYFSVISADHDVAKATSSRFLLKVHGDFRRGYKGKHVVLKESDYVNYEQNYPLISNLMKTIMATHTIVFIGYGLGDYNINLLLNWVKTLQKDGYNKPFFIRTDHQPIEENTAVYYETKGLRIIDSANLGETEEMDYAMRYDTVMDLLIESRENGLISNDDEVVEFIYQKLSPLFALQNIRKLDLNTVFEHDYHFEVNGTVVPHKNKGFGYMERFFELKTKGVVSISELLKQKFEEVSMFFNQNGILGMLDGAQPLNFSFSIESPAYDSNFDEMERLIQQPSTSLEEDYRKAFYLSCLGRWEEAYNFYSDLLLSSIDESSWWIHYLSQINRYRLYQSITQTAKRLGGFGLLYYGQHYRPFSDDFLTRIDREMKNFDINDIFGSMPHEFQDKYSILEFLSDNKFLYDDTVKLFELTNKVRSEISKGSYSMGMTADLEVQLRLDDNLRFLYGNSLWSSSFHEFKQYMRNSLILHFEKAEYEKTRDIDDFGFSMGAGESGFYVNYYDFVNVAKSFTIDDIKHIERSCKIEQIEFRDNEKIESFLIRLAEELIKRLSGDGVNIVFYNRIIPEATVAFYFARYVKLSTAALTTIFKTLLFYFSERDLDVGQRYLWTQRLTISNGLPTEVIAVIEQYLISQADRHQNSEFSEQSTNNLYSKHFVGLIRHFNKDFISIDLSQYALSLLSTMKNQIDYIYPLSPILSADAKGHLLRLKKIDDINGLMDSVRIGIVENITDYEDLIIKYMEDRMSNTLTERKNGVISVYGNNYVPTFGVWYFLGDFRDPKMKNFIGFNDEYDLFVEPESFDYNKFKPIWLKQYSEVVLKNMAENEHIRPHLIEVLKERIKNTNDKNYLEIFMKHFVK
ncbi:SIR2 family protein [Paenibacillus sp. D51F]